MTAPDLTALRAAAEAATPGEWWARGQYVRAGVSRLVGCDIPADATFIAAANPTAVLGLLDEFEALRAAVERVEALADRWADNDQVPWEANFIEAEQLRAAIEGTAP